jgi:hypothetical protein
MLREDVQNGLEILTKPRGSLWFREAIARNMALMQGCVIPEFQHHRA